MLKIRKPELSDLKAIKAIEALSFPKPWAENQIEDEIRGHWALVAEDGSVMGYLFGRQVADEFEVLSLAVDPGKRGKGTAQALLAEALRLASEGGVKKVFLEVRESNLGAIRLYSKAGFRKSGMRKSYYHDGENALTMDRNL